MRSEFQKSKSGFRKICVPTFRKVGQLWIFRQRFGKTTQSRAIFWFLWDSGCCWELRGGWNEMGGAVWNWIEVGASLSNTRFFVVFFHIRITKIFIMLIASIHWKILVHPGNSNVTSATTKPEREFTLKVFYLVDDMKIPNQKLKKSIPHRFLSHNFLSR